MQAIIRPAPGTGYTVSDHRHLSPFVTVHGENMDNIILTGTPEQLIQLGADIERAGRELAGQRECEGAAVVQVTEEARKKWDDANLGYCYGGQ